MKSKYETLLSVIKYVENESDDVVSELLTMGFTPCQLVNEFGFDEMKVKQSPVFSDIEDSLNEKLNETEYPFVLDNYSSFDAALLSRFELTKEQMKFIKNTELYREMKCLYKEEKEEALIDVLNDVFNNFDKSLGNLFNSIIDLDVILSYEKDTGKQWREDVEERMAKICSFYEYGFNWNEKGNIVINNHFYDGTFTDIDSSIYDFHGKNIEKDIAGATLRHYEYESAEAMIADWIAICKDTNADYTKNGQDKPFAWADEKPSLQTQITDAYTKSKQVEKEQKGSKENEVFREELSL